MRVRIVTDEYLAPELIEQLEHDPEIEIQESRKEENLTEQAFAIGEISVVIALVKGAAALARTLKSLIDKRGSLASQKLRVETAFGAITLEVREDITLEELREALEPLFAAA